MKNQVTGAMVAVVWDPVSMSIPVHHPKNPTLLAMCTNVLVIVIAKAKVAGRERVI